MKSSETAPPNKAVANPDDLATELQKELMFYEYIKLGLIRNRKWPKKKKRTN